MQPKTSQVFLMPDGDAELKRWLDIDPPPPAKSCAPVPRNPHNRERIMMRMITVGFFSHNQYINVSNTVSTAAREKAQDIGSHV